VSTEATMMGIHRHSVAEQPALAMQTAHRDSEDPFLISNERVGAIVSDVEMPVRSPSILTLLGCLLSQAQDWEDVAIGLSYLRHCSSQDP